MDRSTDEATGGIQSSDAIDVAVIGAGQAGLAIGSLLRRQGRRFVILERADSIGAAWRQRWESLTLFTPRRYSALPGLPFAGDPDGLRKRYGVKLKPRLIDARRAVSSRLRTPERSSDRRREVQEDEACEPHRAHRHRSRTNRQGRAQRKHAG